MVQLMRGAKFRMDKGYGHGVTMMSLSKAPFQPIFVVDRSNLTISKGVRFVPLIDFRKFNWFFNNLHPLLPLNYGRERYPKTVQSRYTS
jgi:hypothetical protein